MNGESWPPLVVEALWPTDRLPLPAWVGPCLGRRHEACAHEFSVVGAPDQIHFTSKPNVLWNGMTLAGLGAFDPEVVRHLRSPYEELPPETDFAPRVTVAPKPRIWTVRASLTMVQKGQPPSCPAACEVLFPLQPDPRFAGEFAVSCIGGAEGPSNRPVLLQSLVVLDPTTTTSVGLLLDDRSAGSWLLSAIPVTAMEPGRFVIPLCISVPASTSIRVTVAGSAATGVWASCINQAPHRLRCPRDTRLSWESRYVTHAVGSISESQMAVSVLHTLRGQSDTSLHLEGPHWKGGTVIPVAALPGGRLSFGSCDVIGYGLRGPAQAWFSDGTPAVFEVVAELVCSAVFSPEEDNTEEGALVDALE